MPSKKRGGRPMKQIFEWIRQFFDIKSKDVDPIVQFARYGFCGVAATVAHNVVWYLLAKTVFPSFAGMEIDGVAIDDSRRAMNSFLSNCGAFIVGNFVAYFSNVAFVFVRGRHSLLKEFISFTLVALVAFAIASVAGPYLIEKFGIPTWVSQVSFIVASMLVNFVARKFFIFEK